MNETSMFCCQCEQTSTVLNVRVEKFGLTPTTMADADLAAILKKD